MSPSEIRGAGPSRGDGQHARAAADIEPMPRPPPLEEAVEMHEAPAGGAVMAGAEASPASISIATSFAWTRALSWRP